MGVEDEVSRDGARWVYLGTALLSFTVIGLFLAWVVPFTVLRGTRDRWLQRHATAVLNFALTALCSMLVAYCGYAGLSASAGAGLAGLLLWLWAGYLMVGLIGLLVGAVRTGRGRSFTLLESISWELVD
ncbi:hypothetical protein [Streptomyces sp. 6N223]|uniref:hypothetical protein n=1 Tax=Streptomyces sp. 6N223 TaxID=3457412 RepID=UPI003FCF3CB9